MISDCDVKVNKKYWYYLIPVTRPLNPSEWNVEREPKEIVFNKVSKDNLIGIKTELVMNEVYKTRIGYQDLYESYNDCLLEMIESSKTQIEQAKTTIEFEKERIEKYRGMKK